jgi:cation transport ATPase
MREPKSRRGTLAGVTSDRVRRAGVAAALDGVCLVAFVVLGRGSHGLNGGSDWFLTVLWPFVAGWYAATFITRLYRVPTHRWRRAAATVALGVTLACVIRVAATARSTPVVFGVVAFSFLLLTTVGWRVAARLVARARVRASV